MVLVLYSEYQRSANRSNSSVHELIQQNIFEDRSSYGSDNIIGVTAVN